MNTDHRGQNITENHPHYPLINFFSAPLMSTPTLGDFHQVRPMRQLNLIQNPQIIVPTNQINHFNNNEEQRPMTSTVRRFRVRREENHSHNHTHMMRHELMRRNAGNNERTQSPSSQMLESVFFSLMEQIQSGAEDEHKQELPIEMREKVKRMKMGKSGQQCSVCYENFKRGCKIRKLPCKHIFHDKCIMPWLEKNSTCPNCRFDLFVFFTENPEGEY